MAKKRTYRVLFFNRGTVYELYVRDLHPAGVYGFVEVEGFMFGEKSSMVIDPSEERLGAGFGSVQRTYIAMHAIVRIDEAEKQGTATIISASGRAETVTPFPLPAYTPSDTSGKR